jgi:hypothetical protein
MNSRHDSLHLIQGLQAYTFFGHHFELASYNVLDQVLNLPDFVATLKDLPDLHVQLPLGYGST